jgi:cytoskeletal protein RodZ
VREELHKLGDVLRAAREAKGVDLARVERDTKIRARYLTALETMDYRALPGAVYTRGFLRNYGQYLGLDPEYLIDLYRLESSSVALERPRVDAPPRPISAHRGGAFVVTPNALAATILTIVVVGLVAYFGYEFWTFARTPDLRITAPAGDVAAYDELAYTVRGVTAANSRITVTNGQRENPEVQADQQGAFSIALKLVPGSNVITLIAHDPVTKRDSDPVSRTINVVLSQASPTPAAQLAVSSPQDKATVDGKLTVSGTATAAARIAISAKPVAAPKVSFAVDGPSGALTVKATPPAAPKPISVAAGSDGAFSAELSLPPGSYQLTVSADGAAAVTRAVSVSVPAGLSGAVTVSGAPSYLEIDQDGKRLKGTYGGVVEDGTSFELKAKQSVRIRAGNAVAVQVTINGISLGKMGGSGDVVEWHITRDS